MNGRPSVLERAFEMAQSGHCQTMGEIERKLISEHFMDVRRHLRGPGLRSQIVRLCRRSKNPSELPEKEDSYSDNRL